MTNAILENKSDNPMPVDGSTENNDARKRLLSGHIESERKKQKVEKNEEQTTVDSLEHHVDYEALKTQIEYYFSDKNLSRDRFFHSKISENSDGWMDLKFVLSCKKIQALKATSNDIVASLKNSHLETKIDSDNTVWIRRTTPIPSLDLSSLKARNDKNNFEKKHAYLPKTPSAIHNLGCWLKVSNIPAEASWVKVKEALSEELKPETKRVRQVTPVDGNGNAFVYMRKFENDQEQLRTIKTLSINGVDVCVSLIDDIGTAQKAIESLPANIGRDREKEWLKLQREISGKPVQVGDKRFESMAHLKKCCKELLTVTDVDTELKPSALSVIQAVLQYHPAAKKKCENMKTIKVSTRTDIPKDPKSGKQPKCFFIVRNDGSSEDFSILKCLDAMMQIPPLIEEPVKTEEENIQNLTSEVSEACEEE